MLAVPSPRQTLNYLLTHFYRWKMISLIHIRPLSPIWFYVSMWCVPPSLGRPLSRPAESRKPAVFGSVISPHALCCYCPCQQPHRPAPENNPPAGFQHGSVFLICSLELYWNPVILTVSLPIAGNLYYVSYIYLYSSGCKLHITISDRRPVGATCSIQILIFKY